jgi:signal peptidase
MTSDETRDDRPAETDTSTEAAPADADPTTTVSSDPGADAPPVRPEDLPGNVEPERDVEALLSDWTNVEIDEEPYTRATTEPVIDDRLFDELVATSDSDRATTTDERPADGEPSTDATDDPGQADESSEPDDSVPSEWGHEGAGGSVATVESAQDGPVPASGPDTPPTESDSSGHRRLLPSSAAVINASGIFLFLLVLAPFVVYSMPQLVGAAEGFVVLSGSMEPSFEEGDVIIVESVDPGAVSEGDIITFRRDGSETPVTHRVIDIDRNDGSVSFKTKGDANEEADNGRVRAEQLVGRVIFSIPEVGHVISAAATTTGRLLFLFCPLGLLVFLEIVHFVRGRSDDADGEETLDPLAPAAEQTVHPSRSTAETPGSGYSVGPTDVRISLLATGILAAYSAWITYRSYVRTGVPDTVSVSVCTGAITALVLGVWLYASASGSRGGSDRQDVVDVDAE